MATYEILDAPAVLGGKAIRCLRCGRTSYHPQDVENRYCARCHLFHEQELPENRCPHCERLADGVGSVATRRRPQPGDLLVCFYCAGVSVIGEDLRGRAATEEDLATLDGEERRGLESTVESIRMLRRK